MGKLTLSAIFVAACVSVPADIRVRIALQHQVSGTRAAKVNLGGVDIVTTLTYNAVDQCYESAVINTAGYTSVSQITVKPQHHLQRVVELTSPANFDTAGVSWIDVAGTAAKGGNSNYDGIIDIADYTAMSAAFSATPSDSHWNPEVDFNVDEIIDIADYTILSGNFSGVGDSVILLPDDTARLAQQIQNAVTNAIGNVATVTLSGTYHVRGRLTMSKHVVNDSARGHIYVPAGVTLKFIGENQARILGGVSLPVNSTLWETPPTTVPLNTSVTGIKFLPFAKFFSMGPPPGGMIGNQLVWRGGWGKTFLDPGYEPISTFSQPFNGEVATADQPFVLTYDASTSSGESPPTTDTGVGMEIASDKAVGIESPWRRTVTEGFALSEKAKFKHIEGLPNPVQYSSPGVRVPAVAIFPNADYECRVIPITSVTPDTTAQVPTWTVQMSANVTNWDKSYLQRGCRFRYLNDPSLLDQDGEFAWTTEGLYVKVPSTATNVNIAMPTFLPTNTWMTNDVLQTGKRQIAHTPFFAYDVYRIEFSGVKFDTGVGNAIDAQKVGALVVNSCEFRSFGQAMVRSRQATATVRDQSTSNTATLQPQPNAALIPNHPPRAHCLRVTGSSFIGGYREGVAHDKGTAIFSTDGSWGTSGYTSTWHPDEQATLALYKNVLGTNNLPYFTEASDFTTHNVEVEGNVFNETGMVFSNSPALWLYRGVSHANVKSNEFKNVAHMGLYYSGAFFNIEDNLFEACGRATTDIGAIDSILSLLDIGNRIHGNTFRGMQWYPEVSGPSPRSVLMPFDLTEEGEERSLVKTIISGIYFDNLYSHQLCYNNTFEDCQYAFITLGGRNNHFAHVAKANNTFSGDTQILFSERFGAKVPRIEVTSNNFTAILENQNSGLQPYELAANEGLPRLMGNKGSNGKPDFPSSGSTPLHAMYRNQRDDQFDLYKKTYWQTGGAETAIHRAYLAALPSRIATNTFYNLDRFPLATNQTAPVTHSWLDLGWIGLQRNEPLNSTAGGDNQWYTLNMDDTNFYTEAEDFSLLSGKMFCGRVKLTSYTGTELVGIPKQRLYMYLWHPTMSTTRGQRTFRTVLDSNGRFAIMLPHSWTHVQVRTESGLWKKIFLDGSPVVVPSGTPAAEAAFNYIPWSTTLQSGLGNWQDLQICYGDVNWDNSLAPAGADGVVVTNRFLAQVRVAVPNGGMTTYNYSHLVDLNRDNAIDQDDLDQLELAGPGSGAFAGAQ